MIDVGSGSVQAAQVEGDLSVDTGSGPVKASQVKNGRLSIDTGSGDVTGTDCRARRYPSNRLGRDHGSPALRSPKVSLETGSGRVTADLRGTISDLQIETGSGDIAIQAPATLGAAVEIETSSGEIETDFPLQVTRQGRDHIMGTNRGREGNDRDRDGLGQQSGSQGVELSPSASV